MKRVTICIPTYNAEKTLGETLDSVLDQSYSDIQVKIFDNASTDKTVQLALARAKTDPRIQVFENSQNVGAERNFDRCLKAAEGDYTAIYHSDDVYENTIVEKQVAFLDAHAECAAVATQAVYIDGDDNRRGERFLPRELRKKPFASLSFDELFRMVLKYGNFVTCPSVMARSKAYRDEIEVWDGSRFGSSADLDVWFRLARLGNFGFITKPLMRYRVSNASFTVRETKRRVGPHDLLRVLRAYLYDPAHGENDSEKQRYFEFHQLKDVALRRMNILTSGRKDLEFPIFEGQAIRLLPLLFESRYHFKFLMASYAILAVTGLMKKLGWHR